MAHTRTFDEIENQKRMVPMFESTVPVSSLVNYNHLISVLLKLFTT